MNIRVIFSEVVGSSEKDIEEIEKYLLSKQPFGLACSRSLIIFMPEKEKGYWLWADHRPGPVFQAKGWSEFVDTVKMQYLTHKKVLSTDEILAVTSILDYERKQKQLAVLRSGILPEPGQSTGPVETGGVRILPGGDERSEEVFEHPGAPTLPILLPEPIRDAKSLPGIEDKNSPAAGG